MRIEHRACRLGTRKRQVAEADLARRHARGRRACPTPARRPVAIAGSSRRTAATGAAAPSSAQLSPPNAIIDVPDRALGEDDHLAEGQRPADGGVGERPEHDDVGGGDEQQAPEHRPLAQPRRLVLQLVQLACAAATKRSMVQSASPNSRSSFAGGGSTASR